MYSNSNRISNRRPNRRLILDCFIYIDMKSYEYGGSLASFSLQYNFISVQLETGNRPPENQAVQRAVECAVA